MNVMELITDCVERNISLTLTDDYGIDVHAEKGALTPDLIDLLKEHKEPLVEWLKKEKLRNKELSKITKTERTGAMPLSFPQQRLWYIDRVTGASSAYNMPSSLLIEGGLDYGALNRAFKEIVNRHESFRTSFHEIDGRPVQVVSETIEFSVDYIEISDARVSGALEEHSQKVFDLTEAPLFSVKLFKVEDDKHIISTNMHHIISDGWSLGIVAREFNALYKAYVAGVEHVLPSPEYHYGDFAQWQRRSLYLPGDEEQPTAALKEMLNYWEDKLKGAPEAVQFHYDHAPEAVSSFKGGNYHAVLPPQHADFLKAISRKHNTTLFTSMLCALNILLCRWTNQDDLVIGTVVAGRNRIELESVVGCFMNFLALRERIEEEVCASDLLANVRETVMDALHYQDCPFDLVVNKINPSHRNTRSPLYNASFRLHNIEINALEMGQADIQSTGAEVAAAQLDLMFEAIETPEGLVFAVGYDASLFNEETACKLFDAYVSIIDQWMKKENLLLSDFQLTDDLIRQAKKAHADKPQLVISSTFTIEPIEEVLGFWFNKLNYQLEIKFAPYNQPFQQLLDPGSLASTNISGFNLFLIRWDDWYRDADAASLQRNYDDFVSAVKSACSRSTATFVIQFCPLAPENIKIQSVCLKLEGYFKSEFDAASNVHVLSNETLSQYYPVADYYDAHSDKVGHIPYTENQYAALGTMALRKLYALSRLPYKVIVLDCDNTLWNGVCGELGPLGVKVTPEFKQLQKLVLQQRDQGLLLCLCSKNNEEDALAVFSQNADMVLGINDIAAHRINWLPKSENIKSLADELNLGLDSFIFIDDDAVQCAEVSSQCPQVMTIKLPSPDKMLHFLDHVWPLDINSKPTSSSGIDRSLFHKQNQQRQALESDATSLGDFIENLDLKVKVLPLSAEFHERAAELCQRTNQFNCTTRRHKQTELAEFLDKGQLEGFVVKVSDRFGDYGIVGLALYSVQSQNLVLDTFLLSCRAMGRGIEHEMVRELGRLADNRSVGKVDLTFQATAKNEPARIFLESLGLKAGNTLLSLDPQKAINVSYKADAVLGVADKAKTAKAKATTPTSSSDSKSIQLIADTLDSADSVFEQLSSAKNSLQSEGEKVRPENEIQQQLLDVFSDVLRVDELSIHDDFFDLGGSSIKVVQMVALIKERCGKELRIVDVMENPTVKRLSEFLASGDQLELNKLVIGNNFIEDMKEKVQHDPIEIKSVSNRYWMFRRGGKNHLWALNMGLKFDNSDKRFTFSVFEKCMIAMMVLHEGMRLSFELSTKQEKLLDLPSILNYQPIVEMDGGLSDAELVEQIVNEVSGIRIDGCLFRAFYMCRGDAVYMVFSAHHVLFDGYAIQLFASEFNKVFEHVVNGNEKPLNYQTNHLKEWADKIHEYACGKLKSPNGQGIERDADFWFNYPWDKISKLPCNPALAHLDLESNKLQLEMYIPEAVANGVFNLAKSLGISPMDVHIYALAKALQLNFSMENILFELSEVSRQYDFIEQDASSLFAYLVSPSPLLIQLNNEHSTEQGIISCYEFRQNIPNNGLGLDFLRYLSDNPEYKRIADSIPNPDISYNYQAGLGEFVGNENKENVESNICTQVPVVIEDEDMLRSCPFYIATNYAEDGRLRTQLQYCKYFFTEAVIEHFLNDYLKQLESLATNVDHD